jgi:hypothetical protein
MTASHKTPYFKNSAIFNTIGYIMVIAVNTMATLGMLNGMTTGEVSDHFETLFTPAGITFSIWGVIYLTLLGFVGYQLWLAFSGKSPYQLEQFMERMRGWWLISCLANSCWLFSWQYELVPLSMLIMLTLLISLLAININFNISLQHVSRPEWLFIYLPFSLYLGWIVVATLANIAAFWVYAGGNGASVPFNLVLLIICAIAITLLIVRRNNIVVGLVALWALAGIIIKRQGSGVPGSLTISIAAIIVMAVVVIAMLIQLLKKR